MKVNSCYDPPNEGLPQLFERKDSPEDNLVVMTLQMRDFHNNIILLLADHVKLL